MNTLETLVVDNLCYQYDQHRVLADLSFSLAPHCALMLKGANGSGKSTLLKILAGLLEPCAGRVSCSHKRRRYYLGHRQAVKPMLTVRENFRLLNLLSPQINWSREASILARFQLSSLADTLVKHLSAGQRQRVALARLLFLEGPCLWLLDEPFTSLDASSRDRVKEVFLEQLSQGGQIVFSSHEPAPMRDVSVLSLGNSC